MPTENAIAANRRRAERRWLLAQPIAAPLWARDDLTVREIVERLRAAGFRYTPTTLYRRLGNREAAQDREKVPVEG